MSGIFENLEEIEIKFDEYTKKLSDPDIASNHEEYQKYAIARSKLGEVVEKFQNYKKLENEIKETEELLELESDEEMRLMAKEELSELKEKLPLCFKDLQLLLLPKDPNDAKDTMIEIRAGAGGDEAGLFAGELMRMYCKFAEAQRWKTTVMSSSMTGVGGYKEVIFSVVGKEVYSKLKYESGVHRVQRVPETESQGRIHTSTVTVAVMPEAEDVDLEIDAKDLRIDVCRASGPGGQSVNTTDSAVRITHLPSGLVVQCQDEKSQLKNKDKAMKVLRSRLLDMKIQEQQKQISAERKSQIGTGDRSERIRTYNFPQGRMTDHRIGLTMYNLDSIMEGNIEDMINSIRSSFEEQKLKNLEV